MRSAPRPARALLTLVVASVALLGCTGGQQRQPTDYGEINTDNKGYYGNLMFGCTGVQANEDGTYDTSSLPEGERLETPDYCTCVFRGLDQTVPFPDAKAFDEAQADAPEGSTITLPANIDKVRTDCAEDESSYS